MKICTLASAIITCLLLLSTMVYIILTLSRTNKKVR